MSLTWGFANGLLGWVCHFVIFKKKKLKIHTQNLTNFLDI
jgi:hypothetical protein